MIDIIEAIRKNREEAKNLLKDKGEVMFVKWDDNDEEYKVINNENDEDAEEVCPWIRQSDIDGEIITKMVIGVRYNSEKDRIEVIDTDDMYTKVDNDWYCVDYFVDDISDYTIYEKIGEMFG